MKKIWSLLLLGICSSLLACGSGGGSSGGAAVTDTVTLKLALGQAGNSVKAVETTITLPDGVSVPADATGAVLPGFLTPTIGGRATNLFGQLTQAAPGVPAPATLTIILLNADPGFAMASGDIVTLSLKLATGVAAPGASAFVLSGSNFFDVNGAPVSGPTLSLH